MTKEEQIREKVRKMLNQILDEEFIVFIKEIEEKKTRLSSRNRTEVINGLILPKNNIKVDGANV